MICFIKPYLQYTLKNLNRLAPKALQISELYGYSWRGMQKIINKKFLNPVEHKIKDFCSATDGWNLRFFFVISWWILHYSLAPYCEDSQYFSMTFWQNAQFVFQGWMMKLMDFFPSWSIDEFSWKFVKNKKKMQKLKEIHAEESHACNRI